MVRRYALRMLTISQSAQALFIAITVLVNLVVLGRSYVTMLVLDFGDLGLVALLQSIILLVGTLQFGFHQGGYRLICSADADKARRINNLVYSYTALVGIIAVVAACGLLPFVSPAQTGIFMLLGAFGGGLTLIRNWLSNQMIALQMLKPMNWMNLWSAAGSLLPLLWVNSYPLAMCAASIILQPVLGIAIAMYRHPELRPAKINIDRNLAKAILSIGFVMFCASTLMQLTMQVERWYVVSFLGIDALGHLYLAILFVSLFQIVPNALNAIYLPKLVGAFDKTHWQDMARFMRELLLCMLAYCVLCVAAVYLAGAFVVELVLPRYVPDMEYVRIIVIGLVFFTIANVFAISFDVLMKYRPYLIAYGIGVASMALVLASTMLTGYRFDLAGVSWVKTGSYGVMAVILLFQFAAVTRHRPEFRRALALRTVTS